MPKPTRLGRQPAAMPDKAVSDFSFATHDGRIWPRARAAMTHPDAIAQRMAEDMEHGATDADLLARGWTHHQIAVHEDRAARVFLTHERGLAIVHRALESKP